MNWEKKVVLNEERAKYRCVKVVDRVLKENKMMLIHTIPYTLEFLQIYTLINLVKI